jgi:cysteine desulfurase/selenocysteine lyase
VTYNDPPHRFEAGTPPIVQAIGLGVALDYMEGIGREAIAAHEASLRDLDAKYADVISLRDAVAYLDDCASAQPSLERLGSGEAP